jgi:hypothetical protein
MSAAVRETISPARSTRQTLRLVPVIVAALTLITACGPNSGATAQPTVTVTASVPAGGGGGGGLSSATPTASASGSPGIVAVTTAGALVVLDPSTGSITQTLVSGGVLGDEISVSPDGSTAYFAMGGGCHPTIESIGIGGGSPVPLTKGELPAISPNGAKLAFTREPSLTNGCIPSAANLTSSYKLVIRTLSTGAEQIFPMPPALRRSGLPAPIGHLSWASDSTRLLVSTLAVQDNEGWGLDIVDTSTAQYYVVPGAGISFVPVTGPQAERSYIREGIFLPDGDLFISRACCGGVPIHNTSRLMWEVTASGALVHQVAIGFPNLDHTSLAANSTGQWLLYLAGPDLYVSENGARPSQVASGLIAATWQ